MDKIKYQHIDFPHQLIIESTSACNQRCIKCGRNYMNRKIGTMKRELFDKLVEEVSVENPLTEIWPAFMGESMLLGNKLFKGISYAKEIGCEKITLNTNGTLIGRNLDGIINSGLDRLIVSCDAHTPQTHHIVRPGVGKYKGLKIVYSGVHELIDEMKRLNVRKPLIEMQYSMFEENKHEKKDFINYWIDHGVVVKVRPNLYWSGSIKGGEERMSINNTRVPCLWVLDSLGVHWNGDVVICAVDDKGKGIIGNSNSQTLKNLWEDPHREVREAHLQKRFNEIPEICKTCPDWKVKKAKAYFPDKETEKLYVDYIRKGRIFMEKIPETEEDLKVK